MRRFCTNVLGLTRLTTKMMGLILLCLCAHAHASPAVAQDTREEQPARSGRRKPAPPAGPGALTTSTKKFDLVLFEANLRKAFDGKATGYAYAINQNGQLKRTGENGYAILARDVKDGILLDPKGVKHHAQLRMNIASVSKPVTAVNWTKTGGGGGWNLSARELAQFLAHVRFNDKILSPATRKLMDENYLGWMDPAEWDLNREHGAYLGHRGDLNWRDADKVKVAGMTSLILNFPNGVQVSLLVNSLGAYGSTHKVVAEAFDAAWK